MENLFFLQGIKKGNMAFKFFLLEVVMRKPKGFRNWGLGLGKQEIFCLLLHLGISGKQKNLEIN